MVEVIVFTCSGGWYDNYNFFIELDEMNDVEHIIFDKYKFSHVVGWEMIDRNSGRKYEKTY